MSGRMVIKHSEVNWSILMDMCV